MTDIDAIVEDIILEHGAKRVYDAAKAREYYLRTRKLKGRVGRKLNDALKTKVEINGSVPAYIRKNGVREEGDLVFRKKNRPFRFDRYDSKFVSAKPGRDAREERLEQQQLKASAARTKVSKLKDPAKRKRAEIKLDALERKLNKARNKILNAKKKVENANDQANKAVKNAKSAFKTNTNFSNARLERTKPKSGKPGQRNPFTR